MFIILIINMIRSLNLNENYKLRMGTAILSMLYQLEVCEARSGADSVRVRDFINHFVDGFNVC